MASKKSAVQHISVAVALLILLAVALRSGIEVRAHRKVRRFLHDLQALHLGDPSSSVEEIVRRYEGKKIDADFCPQADNCYSIYVGPNLALERFLLPRKRLQRLVGFRPWTAVGTLQITRGKLTQVDFEAGVAGQGDEGLQVQTRLQAKGPSYDARCGGGFAEGAGPFESFEVSITDLATPSETRQAFDVDLSCAITYLGCRSVCELIPSAWLAYERDRPAEATPETANDADCKRLAPD
ncbi:MAG TPA: hypothetical protein VIY69_07115 [Candidatus Acidoferrales bacterium]